jgi:DNA-binding transcriptional MocR family regulator
MNELVDTPSSKITAEIRAQIVSGDLAVGDRIPSTREIMRRWGVAMATASKVLAGLKDEGLVRTKPATEIQWSGPRCRSGVEPRTHGGGGDHGCGHRRS